jgi:hypothetical protein
MEDLSSMRPTMPNSNTQYFPKIKDSGITIVAEPSKDSPSLEYVTNPYSTIEV